MVSSRSFCSRKLSASMDKCGPRAPPGAAASFPAAMPARRARRGASNPGQAHAAQCARPRRATGPVAPPELAARERGPARRRQAQAGLPSRALGTHKAVADALRPTRCVRR